MCFGNDDGPNLQHIPDPPPEKAMMDFINHITGSETITVTDANGNRRRVTQRLPRLPNEQMRFETGENLIASTIRNLTQLNRYDPKSMISFAPLIETFSNLSQEKIKDIGQFANLGDIQQDIASMKQTYANLIDEQFNIRERANEERLAHSGRGSSTYAAGSRAALARAHGLARAEGDAKARGVAEDIAAKRLATNTAAFKVRDAGRQGVLEAAQADYALNKADEQDQENRRLQAMNDNQGMFNLGAGLVKYDDAKAMSDRTQEQALNTYLAENNVQNARYGAQVNAINSNNQMAMQEYANRPPSFGEMAMGLAGKAAGAIFTASGDSMAGRLGKKIF